VQDLLILVELFLELAEIGLGWILLGAAGRQAGGAQKRESQREGSIHRYPRFSSTYY
jgi:hypothetical protein